MSLTACDATRSHVASVDAGEAAAITLAPTAAAATLLARAWHVDVPDDADPGTLVLMSRMSAWYALDTWARGPSPFVLAALDATTDHDAANAWVDALSMLSHRIDVNESLWAGPPMPIPDELRNAVEGEILLAEHMETVGWFVVGGLGPNAYDLSTIAGVFDCGGDDAYVWIDDGAPAPTWQAVIDLSGDDTYRDLRADRALCAPPRGAICTIDDHAGNDEYQPPFLAKGVQWPGLGLIIERDGAATVSCAGSSGARGLVALIVGGQGGCDLIVEEGAATSDGNPLGGVIVTRAPSGWHLAPPHPRVPRADGAGR